jgi:hypothetical protein
MDTEEMHIDQQMNTYIAARDAEAKLLWSVRKKAAAMILRRTLELAELEAEQAAGLDRTNLINMIKNIIVTLKENAL